MTDTFSVTASLLARAAQGDQRAWDELVAEHSRLLWAVARSFRLDAADANDVVQTTWLRLVEHLDRIEDPTRLVGWLVTTARREAMRVLRRAGRERRAISRCSTGPTSACRWTRHCCGTSGTRRSGTPTRACRRSAGSCCGSRS